MKLRKHGKTLKDYAHTLHGRTISSRGWKKVIFYTTAVSVSCACSVRVHIRRIYIHCTYLAYASMLSFYSLSMAYSPHIHTVLKYSIRVDSMTQTNCRYKRMFFFPSCFVYVLLCIFLLFFFSLLIDYLNFITLLASRLPCIQYSPVFIFFEEIT